MRIRPFLRQTIVVFWKELRDSSRDRRALFAVVVGVLVGPLAIGIVVNRVADLQRKAEEIRIPVAGADRAPLLVDWLRAQSGVEIAEGPSEPERAVRDGD